MFDIHPHEETAFEAYREVLRRWEIGGFGDDVIEGACTTESQQIAQPQGDVVWFFAGMLAQHDKAR